MGNLNSAIAERARGAGDRERARKARIVLDQPTQSALAGPPQPPRRFADAQNLLEASQLGHRS
jgi:hypothetical protein